MKEKRHTARQIDPEQMTMTSFALVNCAISDRQTAVFGGQSSLIIDEKEETGTDVRQCQREVNLG